MADILLLEPGYHNKYPPLGLMKISYFHKHICGDYVRFAKGELPEHLSGKKWDRVYVTTLFTFEWETTKKTIEYALNVVKDPTQVYTGGILASLMPELIENTFPMVKNNKGLLNKKGTLGLPHEECIDTITPDYSILNDISNEYIYPAHDAYFTYMTRGCGMKCQFCAVQTLEPSYLPYLSIKDSIKKVDKEFGPKKDLLLMDNNVLRSPKFDQIIDEIKELGFAKGATFKNPKTGKTVQRFVDFNQGLDAYLLTPAKAKRLGELALRPARIAFDHIEDEEAYKKAIRLCAENGITHMSNYLLYNGDDFSGKGHEYHADTPEDLYKRMRITLDLCDELNEQLDHKIAIFSFPMRYIPLSDLRRGYVGKNWNMKYLRALQRMLIPTQGKGVSSRSFFYAAFGKDEKEFIKFLALPESHLGWRGHFVEQKKDESDESVKMRYKIWEGNQSYIKEWNRLYQSLGKIKKDFIDIIGDNVFSYERFSTISDPIQKKLFIHYFTIPKTIKVLAEANDEDRNFIFEYIYNEFPIMYKRLIDYICTMKITYSMLEGPYKANGENFFKDVLFNIDFCSLNFEYVIDSIIKFQQKLKVDFFDFNLIKYAHLFYSAGVFDSDKENQVLMMIRNFEEKSLREFLLANLNSLKIVLEKTAYSQVGNEYLMKEIEHSLKELIRKIRLFGE